MKLYFKTSKCYGLYKQDSTGTKRGLVLGQNQYIECGTNRTNKAIGRGVSQIIQAAYNKKFGT